jgi:HAE1 family hydrophobic/amphiphilic exporter-1
MFARSFGPMLNGDVSKVIRLLVMSASLLLPNAGVLAQTPTATPNPTQRDATRPPGTRPETQDPRKPPSTQQPTSPRTPPGNPNPNPSDPNAKPRPNAPTIKNQPVVQPTPQESTTPAESTQEPAEPNFPTTEPRPLPPMPNLTRLGVLSSNVVSLSLNESIRLALANNNDIEVSRDDVRYAETQLHALQGFYDPVFSITPQLDNRVIPVQNITQGAPTGKLSTQVFSWNPTITKSFSRGGGTYELSFSNGKNTTSSTVSTLNPYYSSNLALSISQPLWRNRSIDFNRRQIRVQKKRIEQSDADFRRMTIDVISRVQSAYWDLVFALRDQQVQLDNVNLSRENLRQIEAQISAGAKAPLDRSEVLTELANRESALLFATQTVSIAENALKQLILKDTTATQWSAQITPTDNPVVDTNPVNLDDAITEARKNRPELQRLRLQRDINGIDLQYFRNQTKPQIDIVSTLATTGLAGTPCNPALPTCPPNVAPFLIGGYGKDLSNLAKFQTRNITVGVTISLPLNNTTAKANLAGARIQQEQLDASVRSTEQTVEVDVRNAAQSVESARLQVLSAREARRNAEIQLEGEQRLYSVGRSTTYLLIQRQNALANARDSEVRAETNYSKAVANLQHATSTTLHANSISVDSPVKP